VSAASSVPVKVSGRASKHRDLLTARAVQAAASPEFRRCLTRLATARFLLEDGRLRERALYHVENGASATAAIERVAREYARVAGDSVDEALHQRAMELEALCARMLHRLAGDDVDGAFATPGCVFVANRLTVFEAIELAKGHGAAAVLSAPAAASPGVDVARTLGIPVVCDVRALFRWTCDGDRALVDGNEGVVLLNPLRADVAAHRRDRK
jgi:signal transduction protein with GAF and PtsI domain